jgi:hypothetical protein
VFASVLGVAAARSEHVYMRIASGRFSSVFWCARCVQLKMSAALLASCCAFSAYTACGVQSLRLTAFWTHGAYTAGTRPRRPCARCRPGRAATPQGTRWS